MSERATESVDCPSCLGDGEIQWDWPDVLARCENCDGSGVVEVCAYCHDSGDPCLECDSA